jgi:hypothetical protein
MQISKFIVAIFLSLSLAACSLTAAEPTATATQEPVTITQAAATNTPTTTATTTPTTTPSPTATRPATSGGQTGGQPTCSYNMAYVADMSLPDGTQVFTGTSIVKTWRVRNSGTCAWTNGFTFRQVDGDAMSATTINTPSVGVGATVDIAVTLNVGTNIGAYTPLERANFRMYDNQGRAFGDTLYAELAIVAPNTGCTTGATIVTAPAAGVLQKGQTVSVSWTLRNSGTCTWQNYRIERLGSGSPVEATNLPLTLGTVAPNQTVTFSANVRLADAAAGSGTVLLPLILVTNNGVGFGPTISYEATYNVGGTACTNLASIISSPTNGVIQAGQTQSISWTLRNDGTCTWQNYRIEQVGIIAQLLGTNLPLTLSNVAPNQTVSFTVNVQLANNVTGSGTASMPLLLLTNNGVSFGPNLGYQASYGSTACFYDSDFVADVNVPDNQAFRAGETFTKTWRLRNSGTCAWENVRLVQIGEINGIYWAGQPDVVLPRVESGTEIEISANLVISSEIATGSTLRSSFQLQNSAGQLFGTMPYVQILIDNNIRY